MLRQGSTENRGLNQSNQKNLKPSCLPASMTRNQLYACTEIVFLLKAKNNQVRLSTKQKYGPKQSAKQRTVMNNLPEVGIARRFFVPYTGRIQTQLFFALEQKTGGEVWALSPSNGMEYWRHNPAKFTKFIEWHGESMCDGLKRNLRPGRHRDSRENYFKLKRCISFSPWWSTRAGVPP